MITLPRRLASQSTGFIRHLMISVGTNLTLMVIAVLTSSLSARLLGPGGRGELAQIQLWAAFLNGMGHLAIPDALIYYVSRTPHKIGTWITSAWAQMFPLSIFWIVLAYILLPVLLTNQPAHIVYYAQLSTLILPLTFFTDVARCFIGLKRFDYVAIYKIHRPLAYLALLLFLGATGTATPVNVAVGFVLIVMISPLITVFSLYKSKIHLAPPEFGAVRQLFSYGARATLGAVPDQLNTRLDQMLVAVWLDEKELGLYVISVSWSLFVSSLFYALGTVIFPYVAGADDRQKEIFGSLLRVSVVMVLALVAIMFILTPLIFPLLFGAAFNEAVPVALILVIASGFYNLKLVLSDALRGLGRPETIAYAELTSLIMTVVLLTVLLPVLGIYGAALTSIIAYVLSLALLLYFATRYTGYSLSQMLILKRTDVMLIRARPARLKK